MTLTKTDPTDRPAPLRIWPGVLAVSLQWLAWWVAPLVLPANIGGYVMAIGLLLGAVGVVVWWAFFSRAPHLDRWGALLLIAIGVAVTPRFLHESVAAGNMGAQFYIWVMPILSLAFVAWAVLSRGLASGARRAAMAATILLACGVLTLVRSKGLKGDGMAEFTWRWTQTAEERLLAQAGDPAPATASAAAALAGEDTWPGFRGPRRDGVIPGVEIETDWSASPPIELWRRPVGPGVSSFAAQGGLIYTHEQRGDDEVVACYHATTGEPVWTHHDAARFWDAHVGAGPRATPAVANGRVYSFGAEGRLNALDAADGSVVWSRDVATETGTNQPLWGFVSSPLVVDDLVVVQADTLVAYDLATGELRWSGPKTQRSYSSPHLVTFDGVAQIVQLYDGGAISVSPVDGSRLWEHTWSGSGLAQPAVTPQGDLLVSTIDGGAAPQGTSRIAVVRGPGGWAVEERWSSTGLKTSFSPVVVHGGHAFGFDGGILASIDLEDGRRNWKGGRYGTGQLMLLPDQALLLVVTERGELALVKAAPDKFTELARFPAIEGRTWNQPALVGDLLLVRNGQEMAAFRLPLAGSTAG